MGVRQIIAIPSGVAATGKRLRSLLVDRGDAEARIGRFQARAATLRIRPDGRHGACVPVVSGGRCRRETR
jgi:hypothetical protein